MNALRRFVKSDVYLVLIAVLGFLLWYFQPDITVSAIIVFVVANFLIITQKNSNGFLYLFLIMLVSNIAGSNVDLINIDLLLNDSNMIIVLFLIGILILELFIFLLSRFKKENKPSLWIGLLLITISFAISGTKDDPTIYINEHFADTILMLLGLFLFIVFSYTIEKDKKYISKCLLYLAVYVSIQMIVTLMIDPGIVEEFIEEMRPNLKWGTSNAAALVILLAFPAGAYLYVDKPNLYYFVLTRISIIGLLCSTSRGGIICGILATLLIDIYTRIKVKDRRKYNLHFFGTTAFLLVSLVLTFDILYPLIKFSVGRFLVDENLGEYSSGRFDLYILAFEAFKSSPVIGVGTALSTKYNINPWYHSTFFDILASLGVVGLLTYGVHFFQKYRLFIKNRRDSFIYYIFVGFVCSGIYGMIDVAYFNYIWLLCYILIIASVEVQTKVETLTPLNK